MGVNYRLVAKEQKAEEQRKEGKEDETGMNSDEKPKEVTKAAAGTEQKGLEEKHRSEVWITAGDFD
jgi:MCP family monocarboxylic acid transporter-like MFS transporter 2